MHVPDNGGTAENAHRRDRQSLPSVRRRLQDRRRTADTTLQSPQSKQRLLLPMHAVHQSSQQHEWVNEAGDIHITATHVSTSNATLESAKLIGRPNERSEREHRTQYTRLCSSDSAFLLPPAMSSLLPRRTESAGPEEVVGRSVEWCGRRGSLWRG